MKTNTSFLVLFSISFESFNSIIFTATASPVLLTANFTLELIFRD